MRWYAGRAATRLDDALTNPRVAEATDEELLEVARTLSGLRVDAPVDPDFRVATRARLVALAEREMTATSAPPARRPGTARGRHRSSSSFGWNPRLAGAIAVFAALVTTLSLLTVASRDALPGDTLYGLKRGAERAEVALTFDETERVFTLLFQAEQRLAEVAVLLGQPVGTREVSARPDGLPELTAPDGAVDAKAITETLSRMDEQTTAGIALLADQAVAAEDAATLGVIPLWAEGQQGLLEAVVDEMTPAEQARADQSLELLTRVQDRGRELGESLPQDCLDDQVRTDELGPVPCDGSGTPPTDDPPTSGPPPSTAPETSGAPSPTT